MRCFEAYCSTCDARVKVHLDPETARPRGDGEDALECLQVGRGCDGGDCPLAPGPDGAIAWDLLEFLPAGLEGERGEGRDMEEAARLLERARRASLAHEVRRTRGPEGEGS